MSLSLKAYADLSLATELTQADIAALVSGASPDNDTSFALGLSGGAGQYQASSNPGIDQIVMSIVDANPASEIDVGNIKIALSSAGLDTATGGASLNLGLNIPTTGILIYLRSDTPAFTAGNSDITLELNAIKRV